MSRVVATHLENLRLAEEIVNSAPVLAVYAACEWDELDDDGKDWIAAIVAEAQRRVAAQPVPGKHCGGNLKPAPFALTPQIVTRVLGVTEETTRPSTSLGTNGVSRPSVAAKIDTSGTSSAPLSVTATAPRSEEVLPAARESSRSGPVEGSESCTATAAVRSLQTSPAAVEPRRAAETAPAEPDQLGGPVARKSAALPPAGEPARRSDVMYRQAKDRDARELEAPVDRLAAIRTAAVKLAAREAAKPAPRVPLGQPAERKAAVLPPLWAEAQRAALQGAIANLKQRCVLVTVCDRDAAIRMYRVSGKRDAMLASDVVAYAAALGFEVPA